MSDILDDRRRGLEEEYFHKKNQEAIEKLREKILVAKEAKESGTSTMDCPRCDDKVQPSSFEGVEIDICNKCGGVWLDSAEFEQLSKRKIGWFARLLHSWVPD
jgi:hypothetical protein